MNDYGTMCGSKKKHMYLSHCLHKLLQFYRPQWRLGQSERRFCVLLFFFNAFPQRLLPKQKHSQTWGELLHIQLGGGVCGLGVLPPSNPLPAGFGVTLRPSPPALWPVFRCDCSDGGAQCILDVLIKRHC